MVWVIGYVYHSEKVGVREGVVGWELHGQKISEICLPCMKGRGGGVSLENVGLEHGNFLPPYSVRP